MRFPENAPTVGGVNRIVSAIVLWAASVNDVGRAAKTAEVEVTDKTFSVSVPLLVTLKVVSFDLPAATEPKFIILVANPMPAVPTPLPLTVIVSGGVDGLVVTMIAPGGAPPH